MRTLFSLATAALGILGLAACQHIAPTNPARRGPFFKPVNYVSDQRLPYGTRRVVLLPIHGAPYADFETCEQLDPIIAEALVRQMRFEVVPLTRAECTRTFGFQDIDSTAQLPPHFLKILGTKFDAQAVLFVDLTAYAPYRPLAIGFRAKLANVADQRILWAFDQLYTTNNSAVANSLRHYYLGGDRQGMPFDSTTESLISPSQFAAYVADTTFRTLPVP
ncbi:MAG: hypothetical protein ACREFX_10630 [Opitutaceae bacterium]